MKHYNSYHEYLQQRYGERVYKITIDAGFTCPNRDGTKGIGGCSYCDNSAFNPNQRKPNRTIVEQVLLGRQAMSRKYGVSKFIAYFQAFTNTYAHAQILASRYVQALIDDRIIGVSIGTRPDCLPESALDVLEQLSKKTDVLLEIGLQTANDTILQRINRGHDFAEFVDAVRRTRTRGLEVCVHVILGLPGESKQDMMNTARAVSDLDIQGIKIHSLAICKGTPLEQEYRSGSIVLLGLDEYVNIVCDFVEHLREDIQIHRLTVQTPLDLLVAPAWATDKTAVLNAIHREMDKRNIRQGRRCCQT